jgi:hypothetical protein
MKAPIFTLITGRPLTLFLGSGGIGVFPINCSDGTSYTRIVDGVHGNGGWDVEESYSEVVDRIGVALAERG